VKNRAGRDGSFRQVRRRQWTGHPIGLLIAAGLLLMGLVGVPEFRWFLLPRWPSAEYLVSRFGDSIDST
jgi:hypothetical protein